MAFDPNKFQGNWATYIPSRRPKFKIHKTCGNATSALKVSSVYHAGVLPTNEIPATSILYTKDMTGQWIEVPIHRVYDKNTKSIIK